MVSTSPNKQRKTAANAALHTKRKRMRARCLDPAFANIRSVTVRIGDEVEIRRGDAGSPGASANDSNKREGGARGQGGHKAKVVSIDVKTGKVSLEGLTQSKADNKEEAYSVHASNVAVTKVDVSDPIRLKELQNRNGGDEE